MTPRNIKVADDAGRTWFNLQTTRGWIETFGAAVGGIGAVVTIYFQLFPTKLPANTDPKTKINIPGTVTQTGIGNVIGSDNRVTINITGYTVEQHEDRLKKREAELRAEFELKLTEKSAESRTALEQELMTVSSRLADVKKSYEDRVTELKRIASELETFRKDVPDDKIRQALEALAKGDTDVADGIFAEVEAMVQRSIETAARAAYERGRIAYDEVRWQDARKHFQKAVRLTPDHEDYAYWAARMAELLGDYVSAEKRYKVILATVRSTKGEDAPETSTAMNSLAVLYGKQGHYQEAEPLFKKALEIDVKALPAGHPDLAPSYNNLAALYVEQGHYQEAEPLYNKAIEIVEKALPTGHPRLAASYNNLALLYWKQGRYQEAEPLHKKALEMVSTKLGKQHPSTRLAAGNFANFLDHVGRNSEADKLRKDYGI